MKRLFDSKNKRLVAITIAAVTAVMWALNSIVPEMADDYWYKFVYVDGPMNDMVPDHPVQTLGDIFRSEYNHYFGVNGRSVVHAVVQLFTALIGKHVFNFVNALMFVVLGVLLTRLASMRLTPLNLLFCCSAVLLLYPAFGETMLWMTGSINYLWPSAGICALLLLLGKWMKSPPPSRMALRTDTVPRLLSSGLDA